MKWGRFCLHDGKQNEGGCYGQKGFHFTDGGGFGFGYFWMRWGERDD
jgi:hypothetical protein